ncbi:MAG: DNA repair protein RecO [Planctomycetaceae bacterium]|nr:DNA repair protein RecO [Planctomycetaceae bacterium]
MAAEQALALVVRGTDWSETSRITTLFTLEFGKIRALAKGGRRLKSNFDCAFDLLTVCRIVFLRKSGGLDLLTEARMEERFPVLREKLPALYAGYYIAELLSDGTQDYDPHPALFEAALGTLRELGNDTDPRDAATRFELVWLRELGYSPRLDSCATCGGEAMPGNTARAVFSPSAGGVLCPACGPAAPDRRWLSSAGLSALRVMTEAVESDTPVSLSLTGVRGELRPLLGQTVSFVLGRRPRLLGYVDG